ncbi:MAG: DUF1186 domain-containing protein [Candidatus Sabulitectum sp.]|nr:DUF1186 domain-containing protein [Candidatus Sabulitectum sp.]
MEISDIIDELSVDDGYCPSEAIRDALERKEEITPILLESLENVIENTAELLKHPNSLQFFAMYILAKFRETKAYPLIIQMCYLPESVLKTLIKEIVEEDLFRILASVCDGNFDPIKGIIEDSLVPELHRSAALQSLYILALENTIAKSELVAYMGELYKGKLERNPSVVWNDLANMSGVFQTISLTDEIRKAYKENLIDSSVIEFARIEMLSSLPQEIVLSASKDQAIGFVKDLTRIQRFWDPLSSIDIDEENFHYSEKNRKSDYESVHPMVHVDRKKKIGRNELCPCGSGKKYKKCCGQ